MKYPLQFVPPAVFLNTSFLLLLFSSVSPALQRRLPGATQGDTSAFRHEEDQQAESNPEESDPAGVCGEGHTHICGEPLRRLHVLLLRNATTPLHGHGVR